MIMIVIVCKFWILLKIDVCFYVVCTKGNNLILSYTLSLRTLLWCCERYLVQVLPDTKLLWSWHDQTINICFSPQQLFYSCLFIYSPSKQAFSHNSFSPSFIQTPFLIFRFNIILQSLQKYFSQIPTVDYFLRTCTVKNIISSLQLFYT